MEANLRLQGGAVMILCLASMCQLREGEVVVWVKVVTASAATSCACTTLDFYNTVDRQFWGCSRCQNVADGALGGWAERGPLLESHTDKATETAI
eukprot:6490891-Amphidinium_carterae.2